MTTVIDRIDRLVPNSVEMEESVLGAVMLNPKALYEVMGWLKAEDFYIVRHQWIYETYLALHHQNDPIDFKTVVNNLEEKGRIEDVGGAPYILNLVNNTETALHIESYARVVEGHARRRRLIVAASRVAQAAHDMDLTVSEAESASANAINDALATTEADEAADIVEESSKLTVRIVDRADSPETQGLSWGWPTVDKLFGRVAVEDPELHVVVARSGMGKSTMLRQIMRAMMDQGHPIVYWSLEQSAGDVLLGMACDIGDLKSNLILHGPFDETDTGQVEEYRDQLTEFAGVQRQIMERYHPNLLSIYTGSTDIARIKRVFGRKKMKLAALGLPTPVMFLDTLDTMRLPEGKKEHSGLAEISAFLLAYTQDVGAHIFVAKQVLRDLANRQDKRPRKEDIRGTSQVEDHADKIYGLHRPAHYMSDPSPAERGQAEFGLLKARLGNPGQWRVKANLFYKEENPAFRLLTLRDEMEAGR
jgi:replicative DNA helicase